MKPKNWNLDDMPNQTGQVVIVTGGNSGLGFETVKAFAQKGASVILACRNLEKGEWAKAEILKNSVNGSINVMHIDLMDLATVKSFADTFRENYTQLDILINNAGIMMTPYRLTKDGFESQMGTNHLGHFALTGHLIDLIARTPNSRVVNVSSLAHLQGKMDFDNLLFQGGKDYSPMKAYARSKLANLIFSYQLQRFFDSNSIESKAVAAHPGASYTNLGREMEGKWLVRILRPLIIAALPSAASGALPGIRAAADIDVKGGQYYGPGGFLELSGSPVLVKSSKASHNQPNAEKLWEISQRLTGVEYKRF